MSIRTVNAKASWGIGSNLAWLSGLVYEAPPFYASVTHRVWGSGTRARRIETGSPRLITEAISYDFSATFIRSPAKILPYTPSRYQDMMASLDIFSVDEDAYSYSDTECVIRLAQSRDRRPLISPRNHYLSLRYYRYVDLGVIGTREINYDDPGWDDVEEDILGDAAFFPPRWMHSDPGSADLGDLYDRWEIEAGYGGATGDLVALSLTAPGRDIRGTHDASMADSDIDGSWDTNTITHHVSITIA